MPLTPVVVGTLTLTENGPDVELQAGNLMPYQVGVEFVGPIIAGEEEYMPTLTPAGEDTLTGSPH